MTTTTRDGGGTGTGTGGDGTGTSGSIRLRAAVPVPASTAVDAGDSSTTSDSESGSDDSEAHAAHVEAEAAVLRDFAYTNLTELAREIWRISTRRRGVAGHAAIVRSGRRTSTAWVLLARSRRTRPQRGPSAKVERLVPQSALARVERPVAHVERSRREASPSRLGDVRLRDESFRRARLGTSLFEKLALLQD